MNKSNDNSTRPDVQDDVIELGVASIETLGPGGTIEPVGTDMLPGISDE